MTEELIRSLLAHPEAPIQDIPKYLAAQYSRITRIRNKRYRHHEKLRELKSMYDAACKQEQEDFKKIQGECKHEETSFEADPAGGRDSHRECCICGKTL